MMGYVARTISDETQTLVGQVGEISTDNPSHIVVTADMSSATWNTVATHEVLTVTGLVSAHIWVLCSADLTSGGAATLDLGYEDLVTAWGQDVAYTGADANEIYSLALSLFQPADGNDIADLVITTMLWDKDVGYEIKVAALTGGTLEFHCVWTPLTAGATVVAGAGGTL